MSLQVSGACCCHCAKLIHCGPKNLRQFAVKHFARSLNLTCASNLGGPFRLCRATISAARCCDCAHLMHVRPKQICYCTMLYFVGSLRFNLLHQPWEASHIVKGVYLEGSLLPPCSSQACGSQKVELVYNEVFLRSLILINASNLGRLHEWQRASFSKARCHHCARLMHLGPKQFHHLLRRISSALTL